MVRRVRSLLTLTVAGLVLAIAGGPAAAFPTKLSANGQLDFAYGSAVKAAGGAGTSYKPESKLFYTGDGGVEPFQWWSVLGTSGPSPSAGVWLWELDDHEWEAEIQLPGADPWAKTDVLFDAGVLYVTARDDKDAESGNPRQSALYEIPYLGGGTWGPVAGPFPITTSSIETLTIARDSLGRLWVAHESGGKIKVAYTAPLGTSFTYTTIPAPKVKSDDIATVAAFGGNRIGVFWSDQNTKEDFFAWRADSAPVTASWTVETAYGGGVGGCPTGNSPLCADDHVNVKVYGDEVYVAIKTSLNDASSPEPDDPLIVLLRRESDGDWSSYEVSPVSQGATRPIVELSPGGSKIWVWATRGSEVDVWESPFGSPSFDSGAFVPWVKGVTANDATSTKQVTTEESGVVVVVSAPGKKQYWHNEFLP